jgi:hypothetical protein
MTGTHAITFAGLLGEFFGFVLFYKASTAAVRPDADAARLRTMNHVAFGLVLGGFGLQFLAAGIFMPR